MKITFNNLLNRKYVLERDIYQDVLDALSDFFDGATTSYRMFRQSDAVLHKALCNSQIQRVLVQSMLDTTNDALRQVYKTVHKNKPMLLDAHSISSLRYHFPEFQFFKQCAYAFPALENGTVVGLLFISASDNQFPSEIIAQIKTMIDDYWPKAYELNAQIVQQHHARRRHFEMRSNEEVLLNVIGALVNLMDLRNHAAYSHQRNVSKLALRIGKQLECDHEQLMALKVGGLLHDIGASLVPSEIINKTITLNDNELAQLRSHVPLGLGIVKDIEFCWPIKEIIEQHHERMNGSGYPHGLLSHQIILEARIIAVADVFDALISNRPFRERYSKTDAMNIILKDKGILFDTFCVDALKCLFDADHTLLGLYPD